VYSKSFGIYLSPYYSYWLQDLVGVAEPDAIDEPLSTVSPKIMNHFLTAFLKSGSVNDYGDIASTMCHDDCPDSSDQSDVSDTELLNFLKSSKAKAVPSQPPAEPPPAQPQAEQPPPAQPVVLEPPPAQPPLDVVVQPPLDVVLGPPPVLAPKAWPKAKPKAKPKARAIPWGRFHYAPHMRNRQLDDGTTVEVQIGWGATCLHHTDVGMGASCKRTLAYKGRSAADQVLTDAECLRQVKRWLLHGMAIDSACVDGKTQHMDMDIRNLGPFTLPEDLETPP
jgi:hypothetical protein